MLTAVLVVLPQCYPGPVGQRFVALVVVTLPAGLFWSWQFRRHFNLPVLIASQFVLGAAATICPGQGPLLHLRVGLGALRLMSGIE